MTWTQCLDRTRRELVDHHWVFSWWALAWLNVWRWRGAARIFDDAKIFSEWVPLDLCR